MSKGAQLNISRSFVVLLNSVNKIFLLTKLDIKLIVMIQLPSEGTRTFQQTELV